MKYCGEQGCRNMIERGRYCDDHGRKKSRNNRNSNKSFYNGSEWKAMRSYIYEQQQGCCQRCGRFVFGKQAQVHHIVPVKKNPLLKLEPNNLRLLCPACHSIEENMDEKGNVFENYSE